MTCWELTILIIIIGVVSMIETLAIMAGISRMVDAKAKARVEVTTALFKNEMEYLDKLFDKYMTRIENMVDKATGKK